ncbi:TPA: transposase, partial [Klebsiella pneumoniae]|nr:transposase [Klebsiella pneumoniae]HCI8898515.1 transposase [Klebsiella pneumoniae]
QKAASSLTLQQCRHYNEHHPHSALGYRSPREYIRRKLSQP